MPNFQCISPANLSNLKFIYDKYLHFILIFTPLVSGYIAIIVCFHLADGGDMFYFTIIYLNLATMGCQKGDDTDTSHPCHAHEILIGMMRFQGRKRRRQIFLLMPFFAQLPACFRYKWSKSMYESISENWIKDKTLIVAGIPSCYQIWFESVNIYSRNFLRNFYRSIFLKI